MSKVGVVVLIIAALVFCGLGFVIGQVVQYSGNSIGTDADPVVQQSYVDKLVGERTSTLQTQIDELKTQIEALSNGSSTVNPSTGDDSEVGTTQHVTTTTSVNIRSTASTEGNVLTTVDTNTELVYLGSASSSDGTWYNVRLSDGTEGYVASWFCSEIY